MTINCNGKLLDLSQPRIMGILNTTPDSFYDGGKYSNETEILNQVEQMLTDGADILDIGGYSSRPGAKEVSVKEELQRTIPTIKTILTEFPKTIISIDTFRAEVAKQAVEVGASIVNDISAGNIDERMFKTVAELQVPYIVMHMQGTPKTMQENPIYKNVVIEVNQFFAEKINRLKELKVNDIILDPGFGFGKSIQHNYHLLNHLELIGYKKYPILVGMSRKSMIYKILESDPKHALNGTIALNTIALLKGANILRVHDVKPTKELIKVCEMYKFSHQKLD